MTPRTPLSYVPKYPTGVRGCETPAFEQRVRGCETPAFCRSEMSQ
jgi:hypothetical protein